MEVVLYATDDMSGEETETIQINISDEQSNAVLKEAKDADIPVIIVDRMVDVSDDSLYTAWVGS